MGIINPASNKQTTMNFFLQLNIKTSQLVAQSFEKRVLLYFLTTQSKLFSTISEELQHRGVVHELFTKKAHASHLPFSSAVTSHAPF